MKIPINLYLATSTACNVRCKSCPVGRKEWEPGAVMSLEMMDRIISHCEQDARILAIQLYHYNEPLLLPHMPDMVRHSHDHGYPVILSSNLMVPESNLVRLMGQRPDSFFLSVSGWTQAVYERSHKDGDIERFKRNMAVIARHRHKSSYVRVSWHSYRYNAHEEGFMRDYATSLGLDFKAYGTSLIPQDRAFKVWETGIEDPAGEDVLVPVKEARALCQARKNWPCLLQTQILAVYSDGRYMNCSNRQDEANVRGDLFSTTVKDIFKARRTDPACIECKAKAGHVYSLQAYTRSRWSVLRLGEDLYRKLRLQGRIPGMHAWATNRLYFRPQKKATL